MAGTAVTSVRLRGPDAKEKVCQPSAAGFTPAARAGLKTFHSGGTVTASLKELCQSMSETGRVGSQTPVQVSQTAPGVTRLQ